MKNHITQSLRFLFLIVPIGIFVCVLLQMVTANEMIVVSSNLSNINRRISELEQQNTYLRQQVVQLSSIHRVSKEAKVMGMVDAKQVIAFTEDSFPIAIRR